VGGWPASYLISISYFFVQCCNFVSIDTQIARHQDVCSSILGGLVDRPGRLEAAGSWVGSGIFEHSP
jgi:hypothetical protein